MQKENKFFFSFPSGSTLSKGSENRAENKINKFIFYPEVHPTLSKGTIKRKEMQKENKFFFSFPSERTRAWLLYNQCMETE